LWSGGSVTKVYLIGGATALLLASVAATVLGGAGALWNLEGQVNNRSLWSLVLLEVRLPRVLVAGLVGAALSVSGAALQGLFRNPLADPAILGVSSSAALCAQVMIFTGWAATVPLALPLAASLGALGAMLVLLRLVDVAQGGGVQELILGGVAVGQVAVALSALLLSVALRDYTTAQRLLAWMLGSLDGRTWMHVWWGAGPVLGATCWLLLLSRDLDGLTLGESTAHSLGVNVESLQRQVVIASAVLSGVAVAMGGVISFVGLMIPHLVRRPLGTSHVLLLPGSAVLGALAVICADLISRLLIAPAELQIGVVTAALGAPWFARALGRQIKGSVAA
jgi:iron complex transport system permease protein